MTLEDISDPAVAEIPDPPDYSNLMDWWDAWPEFRPELLDFWARGNLAGRLLSRHRRDRHALLVRVRYVDEAAQVAKRLALLGLEVDLAWTGPTSAPGLCMVPQDVDYEGVGGWGYSACAGSEITDRRGGREWCPSLGTASLLPDTVTDWLASDARGLVSSGELFVFPAAHGGLASDPTEATELAYQTTAAACSVTRHSPEAQLLFQFDLPRLDGMRLPDVVKLCADHGDCLERLRRAFRRLSHGRAESSASDLRALVEEIQDSVAELRLSDQSIRLRRAVVAAGGVLSTLGIAGAIQLGLDPASSVLAGSGAAAAVLGEWANLIMARRQLRLASPFFLLWKLMESSGPRASWRRRPRVANVPLVPSPDALPPHHWLHPPTGGWLIPTMYIPG